MLKIDGHGYSPAVLDKIVSAGGDCKSFQHASGQLKKLAEFSVSQSHVSNLTHEIGRELIEVRDHQAGLHRLRQLPPDADQPPVDLACVETDGGRLMTRAPDQPRGVHEEQWKEPKVGVLWRMTGETFTEDPHPELPQCFQDRERVPKLVREIHGTGAKKPRTDTDEEHGLTLEEITGGEQPAGSGEEPTRADTEAAGEGALHAPNSGRQTFMDAAAGEQTPPDRKRWQPRRVFRTCVATLLNVYGFGPLLAAEAQKRGFYQALRKVFIGDGQEANWTVHRLHFSEFTPVTDFMHAVGYVYAAAGAMITAADQLWERYLQYATACWQGRVDEVIAELRSWLEHHPLPADVPLKTIPDTDPRKIVHEALTYLQHNRERMNYPEYRRQGMPVTSSLVESLIKEFNWRVKGTEKFWNRPNLPPTSRRTSLPVRSHDHAQPDRSAESILQVRAALLCDDHRLEKHITTRPGSPYVRRTSKTQHAASYADTAV